MRSRVRRGGSGDRVISRAQDGFAHPLRIEETHPRRQTEEFIVPDYVHDSAGSRAARRGGASCRGISPENIGRGRCATGSAGGLCTRECRADFDDILLGRTRPEGDCPRPTSLRRTRPHNGAPPYAPGGEAQDQGQSIVKGQALTPKKPCSTLRSYAARAYEKAPTRGAFPRHHDSKADHRSQNFGLVHARFVARKSDLLRCCRRASPVGRPLRLSWR